MQHLQLPVLTCAYSLIQDNLGVHKLVHVASPTYSIDIAPKS